MADEKQNFRLDNLRSKLEEKQSGLLEEFALAKEKSEWHAVSYSAEADKPNNNFLNSIDFVGKNLENGKFTKENLQNAKFSVANLTGVDFSEADLRGVDFSGANLTNANLSGADLSGAIFSGAVLHKTNFTGAKLNGVKFTDADLENAILLDIEIDNFTLEELQELIEYIAKYYPHKLNLSKINLTLLNLQKMDLSQLNLKGVDFTGCDFTGVNIADLDLSECIITPQQIAQALGYMPNRQELAKILAPKKKNTKKHQPLDITDIFLGNKEYGIWYVAKDEGISIETLMKMGKKVFMHGAKKPKVKDEEVLNNFKSEKEMEIKTHNEDLRKIIEERKRKELELRAAKKKEFEQEISKETEVQEKPKREYNKEVVITRGRDSR